MTFTAAIRRRCLDCSGYLLREVRNCHLTRCGLWPFRLGRDPEPGQPRGVANSILPRTDFAEEEAVARRSKKKNPGPRSRADRGQIHFHPKANLDGGRIS